LSDGATTEIVEGAIGERTQVIMGATAQASDAVPPAGSSPFLPQRPGARQGGVRQGGAQ
jgi:hypothetical protein